MNAFFRRLTAWLCTFAVILCLLPSMSFTASAAEGWSFDSATGTLTVSRDFTSIPWSSYYQRVEKVVIENEVTFLPDNAFYEFTSLKEVTMGSGLTTIGNSAFYGCTALERVKFGNAVTTLGDEAFSRCTSLKTVALPDSVTTLGNSVFSHCTALSNFAAYENITSMGTHVFYGCTGMYNCTLSHSMTEIPAYTFAYCTSLSSLAMQAKTLTSIGDYAFYHCESLKSAYPAVTVTQIGNSAFGHCYNLKNLKFRSDTIHIGDMAFSDCNSLTTLELPVGIQSIGMHAFAGDNQLNELIFRGAAPAQFDDQAFYGLNATCYYPAEDCSWTGDNMQQYGGSIIWQPNDITWHYNPATKTLSIDGNGHMNDYWLDQKIGTVMTPPWYDYAGEVTTLYIGDGVVSIGTSAFRNFTALTHLYLGSGLNAMGLYAFEGCTALKQVHIPSLETWCRIEFKDTFVHDKGSTSSTARSPLYLSSQPLLYVDGVPTTDIVIPESITELKNGVFMGYKQMRSLTLHEGLTDIGNYAFYGCSGITRLTIPDSVTHMGNNAFAGCSNIRSLTLGSGPKKLGSGVFSSCSGLTEVVIPSGYTSASSMFSNCTGLERVVLPDDITSIDDGMFNNCSALRTIELPSGVRRIEGSAFEGTGLESIDLPDGLEFIGYSAFAYTESLKSISIPGGLDQIEDYAFMSSAVTEITFLGDAPKIMNVEYVFDYWNDITIHYPQNNDTWTAYIENDMDGYLNWVPYVQCTDGHTWGEWIIDTVATCTDPGARTHLCTLCGENETEQTDPLGHDEVPVPGRDATCTDPGLSDGIVCDRCGTVLAEQTKIPALGHDLVWSNVTEATCTVGGTQEGSCTRCDHTETRTTPAAGHSFADSVKEPTCTDEGYTHHRCSVCGYRYIDMFTDPLGHDEAIDPAVDATCTESGLTEGSHCGRCSVVLRAQNTIPALGHTEEEVPGMEPNCTEPGLSVGSVCNICGEVLVAQEEIPALGHNLHWTTVEEASCTVDGLNIGSCANCDHTEERIIYATGHSYVDTVTPATCTDEGYTMHRCAGCNHKFIDSFVDPLGHSYENGSCIRCGSEDPDAAVTVIASGWSGATQWTLNSDGVLTVYGSGNMKNYGYNGGQPWLNKGVSITAVVIEEGVTAVGSGAFKDLTTLKSVQLPDSGLTKIGDAAFYGCSSLTEIRIPDSIYTVFDYTFKNCTALEDVHLSKNLIKVGQGAFENCTGLTYIFIPTKVNIIGSWSFKGCTALAEADMHWADATEIREGAFKNCSALAEIILPNNIQVLGDSCFYGIGAEKFTIPATVTSIQPWCFARAGIQKIIFEGSAPTIGEGAFNKITLTACYPAGNATWTDAVRQNYGGTVFWAET